MEITIIKKVDIDCCNQCPMFRSVEDTSFVEDSFDMSDWDNFCTHPEADNSSTDLSKYNSDKYGKYIGCKSSPTQKQFIPKWCPCHNNPIINI